MLNSSTDLPKMVYLRAICRYGMVGEKGILNRVLAIYFEVV